MGFLDHIDQLRRHLVRSLILLAIGTGVAFFFSDRLLGLITDLFKAGSSDKLTLLYPAEGFIVQMKISLMGGFVVSSPFIFHQIWSFVSPGLYSKEKRMILPVVFATTLAFAVGVLFGYFTLPYAINYFLSFSTADISSTWSLERFVSFSLQVMLASGVVFEMPLVVYAAARSGLVSVATLRKYRRHVILGLLIVAAILTPPDVITQIILAVPLILLYELGIILAVIGNRRAEGNK